MNRAYRARICCVAAALLAMAHAAGAQQAAPAPDALTLRGAVQRAVERSPDVRKARAELDVALRASGLRRSVFLPNLFTGTDVAYSRGFPLGAPQVFNLSYQQTVFDGPKRGEFRAAQARAEIQRLEADRVRDAVIVRTAAAFLELQQLRKALASLRIETESAARILDVTRERAKEGLELPIEITRAELTLARVKQRLVQSEGRAERLEDDLRLLLGLASGAPLLLAEDTLPRAAEQPVPELVAMAVENSAAVKQAELERRAREHRLRGEKSGYLPTLELVGQYGIFSRTNNYDDFYVTFERHNVTVGLRARIPIFSATRAAQVSLAQSELQSGTLDVERRRAEVETEARAQARRARELDSAQDVARLEHKLAQQNLAVLQAQFDEGRLNLRELERARLEEHDRWRAFLDAQIAQQKAQLEILRSTGQLAKLFQ